MGGSGGIFAWVETAYKTAHPPHSIHLSLSLSSRPTEKAADDCFPLSFFFFRLKGIEPSSQHLLLPSVLFEQLQQGNMSTASQARACLGCLFFYQAFCCSPTHTQHALEAKNTNIGLVANKNKSICIKSSYHSSRSKYKKKLLQWLAMEMFSIFCSQQLHPRIFFNWERNKRL